LSTWLARFVFFLHWLFGNVLVPAQGIPKFGCEGLCQQGIDKIRFLVFGFWEMLTLFARRQSLRDNNRPIQAFVIISLFATTIHQLKPSSAPVSLTTRYNT
jgi:hypothetical protein